MRATKAVAIGKELLANNKYDEASGNREVTFIGCIKFNSCFQNKNVSTIKAYF
ncbi:hypothetical protein DSM03_11215 [Leeuwenhoekiella aestuarii]|uniref:Uncharacterized protein n=1 Tax=Leeuwenhoekiella aestuarii TaxID=2249426 RepID=A0A4Q0NNI9_9FLAO|nr:hypothetical protein DSM04_11013 [Leeuwenhoekiella aestuarii]RXG12038.1 hypothetical protein DSM03_11215 [Leeuwenhoekiella aestuarii]